MLYSIDRFEGNIAVLIDEGGGRLDVPRDDLPSGIAAGDMVRLQDGVFRQDVDAAAARRARAIALQNRLRKRK